MTDLVEGQPGLAEARRTGEEVDQESGAGPHHLLQRLQAGRHDVVVPVLCRERDQITILSAV